MAKPEASGKPVLSKNHHFKDLLLLPLGKYHHFVLSPSKIEIKVFFHQHQCGADCSSTKASAQTPSTAITQMHRIALACVGSDGDGERQRASLCICYCRLKQSSRWQFKGFLCRWIVPLSGHEDCIFRRRREHVRLRLSRSRNIKETTDVGS